MTDMNMSDMMITDERIDELIDRYFDADTTVEEEALLRRAVAHRTEQKYDAIRAVLGFMAVERARRKPRIRPLRIVAAAAAVAAIATVGIGIAGSVHTVEAEKGCYAMIDGRRVDDKARVLGIMSMDMGDLHNAAAEAHGSIESPFDDIRQSISEIEQQ